MLAYNEFSTGWMLTHHNLLNIILRFIYNIIQLFWIFSTRILNSTEKITKESLNNKSDDKNRRISPNILSEINLNLTQLCNLRPKPNPSENSEKLPGWYRENYRLTKFYFNVLVFILTKNDVYFTLHILKFKNGDRIFWRHRFCIYTFILNFI